MARQIWLTVCTMRIGYFTNQYPAPSHTFIRREILAVEALGHSVKRYAIRRTTDPLDDSSDIAEASKTEYLLEIGFVQLCLVTLGFIFRDPWKVLKALKATLGFSRSSTRGLPVHVAYLAEALLLAHRCQRDGIQHVHVHFGTNPATVANLAHELSGIPFSFTVHGPEEFDRAEEYGLRRKLAAAAFAVAISSFGRSQLMRWAAAEDWSKIHVVHCGVDTTYLNINVTPPVDEPRLVCVARLSEQKGHLILLEAAAMLRDEGLHFSLTLVGGGPLQQQIDQTIGKLDLQACVQTIGWANQDTVRQQIRAAKAMVLPSFAEGLPVVIMESMALGRPVISTFVAGIPELVDPDNGWLVPAGDVISLRDAMRDALTASPATLERMGELSRERVYQRHDVSRSALLLSQHIARPLNFNSRTTISRGQSSIRIRAVS